MARYSLRDGKLTLPQADVKHLVIKNTDNEGTFAAPYLKLYPVAKGGDPVYIYVGTANRVCAATTAPIGTSGAFANGGLPLGTAN